MTLPSDSADPVEPTPATVQPEPEIGTVEYWRSEAGRLRVFFGQRGFWENLRSAHRAFNGLLFVWAKTQQVTPADERQMTAILDEYTRRSAYALRLPCNALAY